ncbi:ImmA/IrrE family metallo-endopeptidase [Thermoanaerobacterium thermosaccharolyticum]|uniref:ImmA/IrrE family metallo-endopeptidase n=1 Tax=Thermoanaerobacterium thermosaccharolyticum TaxID=1517 RepID=UPI0015C67A56|nr:ImmA/IrrE family metallo-endopeptidase [Thermoanaerobacterium thermosaccharolyticum]
MNLQILLKKAIIIDNTIYMNKPDNTYDYRSFIIHAYGHYTYGNIEYLSNKDKYEMEAQAFATYFLMPMGSFEKHLELEENDYELLHNFGVTLELVKFRKDLTKALIDSGEYNLLVYSLYFKKDNVIDHDDIYFHREIYIKNAIYEGTILHLEYYEE